MFFRCFLYLKASRVNDQAIDLLVSVSCLHQDYRTLHPPMYQTLFQGHFPAPKLGIRPWERGCRYICFFCDLLYSFVFLFVPSFLVLACFVVTKWLCFEHVITRFTFVFLMSLVVDPPHLREFFFAFFVSFMLFVPFFFLRPLLVRFAWSLSTALTRSSVWVSFCIMESGYLVAASFDQQILSVLSKLYSSSLGSSSIEALPRIPVTILYLIILVGAPYLHDAAVFRNRFKNSSIPSSEFWVAEFNRNPS